MGYIKAEEILPKEVIEIIQQYVEGENIYIPKRANNRAGWGSKNSTKEKIKDRNIAIYNDFCDGMRIEKLAVKYFLSEKSIQRIVYNVRKNNNEQI